MENTGSIVLILEILIIIIINIIKQGLYMVEFPQKGFISLCNSRPRMGKTP